MIRRILIVFGLLIVPSIAAACMWDYDTLAMERARFPSALELITGKFLRHSPEFYEWRIRDREAKLKQNPGNPAYLDDMAVAYDKLGRDDKAIELMLEKEKAHPGLYETAANLGTFYLHSGQTDKGIEQLEKAIKINPDAHFGREKYQLRLAKYLKSINFSIASDPKNFQGMESCFETFRALCADDPKTLESRDAAIKGVLGMMRFGKYDSPTLLRVLGDLLLVNHEGHPIGEPSQDAKQLAARAYLKASIEDEKSKPLYLLKVRYALELKVLPGLPQDASDDAKFAMVASKFREELDEAKVWYEDLRQKELAWIRDGKNPEEEFGKLYVEDPVQSDSADSHKPTHDKLEGPTRLLLFALALAAMLILVGGIAAYGVRRKRRLRNAA